MWSSSIQERKHVNFFNPGHLWADVDTSEEESESLVTSWQTSQSLLADSWRSRHKLFSALSHFYEATRKRGCSSCSPGAFCLKPLFSFSSSKPAANARGLIEIIQLPRNVLVTEFLFLRGQEKQTGLRCCLLGHSRGFRPSLPVKMKGQERPLKSWNAERAIFVWQREPRRCWGMWPKRKRAKPRTQAKQEQKEPASPGDISGLSPSSQRIASIYIFLRNERHRRPDAIISDKAVARKANSPTEN